MPVLASPACRFIPRNARSAVEAEQGLFMPRSPRMLHKCLKAFSFALLVAAAPAAAQDAIIRGTVKSDRDEQLQAAPVQFPDLNIQILSGVNGQYVVTIPAARVRGQEVLIRVRSIGHKPVTKTITLNPGEQTVDFVLPTDVNLLEAIVVTGVQAA